MLLDLNKTQQENVMKTNQIILSLLVTPLLVACGGGGSGSGSDSGSNDDGAGNNSAPQTQKSTVVGTVPGTLIEAFGTDGSYIKVTSTKNGTTKHPFSLELSKDVSYRLVMTTNEDDVANKVVTPIGFVTSTGTGTLFKTVKDRVDLGNIPLKMSRAEITDANNDGVSDEILTLNSSDLEHITLNNDVTDKDGDGLVNVYEDDDGDGISNRDDTDKDGDGVLDVNDADHGTGNANDLDGDGVVNANDVDIDNDTTVNRLDPDIDNDGVLNASDSDDDNNGVVDTLGSSENRDGLHENQQGQVLDDNGANNDGGTNDGNDNNNDGGTNDGNDNN